MRACPHCTEKSGRQLDRFCSIGRGSVRAATAGTVAPSHLLLKFGKLTIKFEMLCKFRKAKAVRCRDSSPFASLSPMVGKLTTKLELLCQNAKQGCRAAAVLFVFGKAIQTLASACRTYVKDVRGLLSRHGQLWLFEIGKAFQTLSSACRTGVRKM